MVSIKKYVISVVLSFVAFVTYAQNTTNQIHNLNSMVERVVPALSNRVTFVIDDRVDSLDFFTVKTTKRKIKITANSAISCASGFNWVLKYGLNSSVSWCGDALDLPSTMPSIDTTITTRLTHQFNYNYCTYGYTMLFWDWEQWEREIDFMALSGVTTPLATIGAEIVWINTLSQFGYTKAEALEFITGPAFLPWFLMGNMEGEAGPLPQEWLDKQEQLQTKILERMRLYGMEPMLQGFYGMVPQSLKERYPDAQMLDQGTWNGLTRPLLLAPTDPLFDQMADVWYEQTKKLYGECRFFAGDLFHEGGHSGSLDVAQCASSVERAMQRNNKNSIWVIQSWGGNPTKKLLSGLTPQNTMVVDICAEYWSRWHEREGFEGYPWVWGHITNWGGNIGSHGRLDAIATQPIRALNDPVASKSFVGTGAFAEGIEVNPIAFDLASEMRWHSKELDIDKWVDSYAQRRYNTNSQALKDAWSIFHKTIYGTWEHGRRPSESVFCAPPSLKGRKITASAWSQCQTYYDTELFAQGVEQYLSVADNFTHSQTYVYDAVDLVRQFISDKARDAYYNFVDSYKAGDMANFKKYSHEFLDLLKSQDELLSSHPMFYVQRWLDFAKKYSKNHENQKFYEYNARLLIGTWTKERSAVRDYGHREWGGMLKDYYLPRWSLYIDYLASNSASSVQDATSDTITGEEGTIHSSDKPKEYSSVDNKMFRDIELKWINSQNEYVINPNADALKVALEVFNRYYTK